MRNSKMFATPITRSYRERRQSGFPRQLREYKYVSGKTALDLLEDWATYPVGFTKAQVRQNTIMEAINKAEMNEEAEKLLNEKFEGLSTSIE